MEEKRGSGGWIVAAFALALLLLPVLYVLSIGPYAMFYAGERDPGWAMILYVPLGLLVDSSDRFAEWLAWYTGLWISD